MTDPLYSTRPSPSGTAYSAPSYELSIDDRPMNDQRGDVVSIRFRDAIRELSYTEIVLNNLNNGTGSRPTFKYSDGQVFDLGQRFELKLGYADGPELTSMMIGELTAIEPTFSVAEGMTVCVRGFDRLHRLRNRPKSKAWKQKNDADIVRAIASDNGLRAVVEDTSQVYEVLPQDNLDDLAFIVGRATRIDYEVFVRDDTLHFEKTKEGGDAELTLDWGASLTSFRPSVTLARQVSKATVRAWHPSEGRLIEKTAEAGVLAPLARGGKNAAQFLEDALGAPKEEVVNGEVVFNDRDAELLAEAVLRRNSHGFITGHGEAVGVPALRAGINVELTNLGDRFSGVYYVTETTHCFDQTGYRTRFCVRRAFA